MLFVVLIPSIFQVSIDPFVAQIIPDLLATAAVIFIILKLTDRHQVNLESQSTRYHDTLKIQATAFESSLKDLGEKHTEQINLIISQAQDNLKTRSTEYAQTVQLIKEEHQRIVEILVALIIEQDIPIGRRKSLAEAGLDEKAKTTQQVLWDHLRNRLD